MNSHSTLIAKLQASFTRKGEDMGLAEVGAIRIPAHEDGSAPAAPTKLRLDIGWSTWKKPKVEGAEEEEGVVPEQCSW